MARQCRERAAGISTVRSRKSRKSLAAGAPQVCSAYARMCFAARLRSPGSIEADVITVSLIGQRLLEFSRGVKSESMTLAVLIQIYTERFGKLRLLRFARYKSRVNDSGHIDRTVGIQDSKPDPIDP